MHLILYVLSLLWYLGFPASTKLTACNMTLSCQGQTVGLKFKQ